MNKSEMKIVRVFLIAVVMLLLFVPLGGINVFATNKGPSTFGSHNEPTSTGNVYLDAWNWFLYYLFAPSIPLFFYNGGQYTSLAILLSAFALVFGILYVLLKKTPIFKEERSNGPIIATDTGITLITLFATPVLQWLGWIMFMSAFLATWGAFILFGFAVILLLISMGHRSWAVGRSEGAKSYGMRADARKERINAKKDLTDLKDEEKVGKDLYKEINQVAKQGGKEIKTIKNIKSILIGLANGKIDSSKLMFYGAKLRQLAAAVSSFESNQLGTLNQNILKSEQTLKNFDELDKYYGNSQKNFVTKLQNEWNKRNPNNLMTKSSNMLKDLRADVKLTIRAFKEADKDRKTLDNELSELKKLAAKGLGY
ncbi:MAG: hypothetical protein GWP09_03180, partial [Nitrospiraceae bacterium]|nr:hypothetical protein [Nitrospiraceae bacterium]